jgi:hypothetical protein
VDSAGRYHADFPRKSQCKKRRDYWRSAFRTTLAGGGMVARFISRVRIQKTFAVASIVLAFGAGSRSLAQISDDSMSNEAMPQPTYAMSENELANLVAPIALYPDGLLGQVLVACTYPDEVVEAQWFLQQNRNLRGAELMEAARQQNWDPSVQVLVAFPDVVALLNRDLRWTTELGNAFLGEQSEVMNAVQDLRAEAQGNGQLASTPELSVSTEIQGDRSSIEIQPAEPQAMFVPNYDPSAVWGSPAEGNYPALPYAEGSGFESLVGTVANLAGLLPGLPGLLGPSSWGWAINWLTQGLFVNNSFFSDFGFHNYGGGTRGTSLWVHDGNRGFGGRYGNNSVASWHGRGSVGQGGEGWQTFGSRARTGFGGNSRGERGNNWRQFGGSGRDGSARQFGGTFSRASRTSERGIRPNYRGGRDSYFANSAGSRGGSFRGSSSFSSESRYNGFATSRAPSRSWGQQRGSESHFSPARMSSDRRSSYGRQSSFRQRSSWKQGSSSRSFKQKAPKMKSPHYAKAHGGGHSSGGHSKRSHHG